mmetsp:Transcript_90743/g.236557  ORF Transcript_90743/g.236557 Transcript_90743/m.236557 type:complete len:100 (+) Transcript_90743:26-325(+)
MLQFGTGTSSLRVRDMHSFSEPDGYPSAPAASSRHVRGLWLTCRLTAENPEDVPDSTQESSKKIEMRHRASGRELLTAVKTTQHSALHKKGSHSGKDNT